MATEPQIAKPIIHMKRTSYFNVYVSPAYLFIQLTCTCKTQPRQSCQNKTKQASCTYLLQREPRRAASQLACHLGRRRRHDEPAVVTKTGPASLVL